MKIKYFLSTIMFLCLFFIGPVFALNIDEPKLSGVEYVSDSSIKLIYKTNNTNPNYKVQIYNMTSGKYYSEAITSTEFTVTGLTAGKTYNFIIRVYYKTTVSNWSVPMSATPKLGAPKVSGVVPGDKQLILNYTVSGSPKEVEIYIVNLKKSVKSSNLSSATITGLTNGTTYNFMMRSSYDDSKYSQWSESFSGVPKAPSAPAPTPTITSGQKIANVAVSLAWPEGTSSSKYSFSKGSPTAACKAAMKRQGYNSKTKWSDCGYFVNTVVRESGVDPSFTALKGTSAAFKVSTTTKYSNRWTIPYSGTRPSYSKLLPGDVIRYKKSSGQHTFIYIGNNKLAEAGRETRFGRITKYSTKIDNSNIKKSSIEVWRAK